MSEVFRGFAYALRPTPDQAVLFNQFAGVCRLVWNIALEQRRDHWRRYQATTGGNLNYITQGHQLTLLRQEFDFIRDVSQVAQERALKNLDDAYRRAWKGQAEYPRPKRKGVDDAFGFKGRAVSVEKINRRWGRVRLPKIGWVKFRMTRPIVGHVCEATVTRTALGWQLAIGSKFDADVTDPGGAAGIDRGVTVPLMLSDGTAYALPAQLAMLERRHRSAQRIVSRRKRGSKRWFKAIRRAAAIKARQARTRKHWAHEATTAIARQYGTVVIERLRTKNMTARATLVGVAQKRGLNRAILNVGWHQIETMLAYKASRLVKVNPAYSSQTCAPCGAVDSQSRKNQASFVCTACGHRDNADRNAAIVILNRGNTPGVEASRWGTDEARTAHAA